MEVVNTALGFIGVAQSWRQHFGKERKISELHEAELTLSREQFEAGELLAKQIYLVDKLSEIEEHFQQLNADLLASVKENERDMWDQRNQQFSNIAVATSIVITGLITVLIQGVLPPGCSDFVVIAYSLSNSLSMGLLFVCAVLCLEVIGRASEFMYRKTGIHSNQVKKALQKSEEILDDIRLKKKWYDNESANRAPGLWGETKQQLGILGLSDEEVEKAFKEHQKAVLDYLERRQKIINEASSAIYQSDRDYEAVSLSDGDDSFSHFWVTYCKFYSNVAIFVFYGGSATLFTSTLLCMWAYFDVMWDCLDAGYAAVAIMLCGLVACFFVAVYLRMFDKNYLEEIKKLQSGDLGEGVAGLGMDIP